MIVSARYTWVALLLQVADPTFTVALLASELDRRDRAMQHSLHGRSQ